MAIIRPFAALRPNPELAPRICELPYDVMSSEEARRIAAGNALSFLHVSKPEIDLPPSTNAYDARVYAKGRENFVKLIRDRALRQDPEPRFYFYRQIMGRHSQVGLVATASCEDYLAGVIKKHELTRPDKEDDRVRHIEALNSQTGPVFLVYRATTTMAEVTAKTVATPPDVDFTAPDGVRHTAWTVADRESIARIEQAFRVLPALYIADGHHRSAAAARVFQARRGAGESAFFLSVIFPNTDVQVLPYHRVVKDLNGLQSGRLLEELSGVFEINVNGSALPSRKHELGLFLDGRWITLRFRREFTAAAEAVERLDVTLLQRHVLAPVLGIEDPRTSKRINFVGGIRGTAELERLVRSGDYSCAFSMYPTSVEDLMNIADAGGVMPPKSTWFEPKLRDAMFCHMIGNP
jgi:uncharacterized protein (DUF1015 family)